MGNAMTATWTKQEVEKYDAHKLRWQLKQHTNFKNSHELFSALLMRHGKPPFYPELRHLSQQNLLATEPAWQLWRMEVAFTINEMLHCSIDPSFVMRKYFLWLQQNWNKHSFGA